MLVQRMRSLRLDPRLSAPTMSVPFGPRRVPRFKRPSTPVSMDDEEAYPEEPPLGEEGQPEQEDGQSSPGDDT